MRKSVYTKCAKFWSTAKVNELIHAKCNFFSWFRCFIWYGEKKRQLINFYYGSFSFVIPYFYRLFKRNLLRLGWGFRSFYDLIIACNRSSWWISFWFGLLARTSCSLSSNHCSGSRSSICATSWHQIKVKISASVAGKDLTFSVPCSRILKICQHWIHLKIWSTFGGALLQH